MELDKQQVHRSFSRFAQHDGFLFEIAAERLMDCVTDMKLQPNWVLDMGGNGQYLSAHMAHSADANIISVDFSLPVLQLQQSNTSNTNHRVLADVLQLPLPDASIDLIWSNLCIEWTQQSHFLQEAKRALKPNGLLALTTLGLDTLQEIRHLFPTQNRVHNFVDMHNLSDEILHNGFTEPIAQADRITLTYSSPERAIKECRQVGAGCARSDRPRGLMGKNQWQQALQQYPRRDIDGQSCVELSFELITITAWRRENQPQAEQTIQFY